MTNSSNQKQDNSNQRLDEFNSLIANRVENDQCVKILLSKYRGAEKELQRITIRPISLRGQTALSFVYTYKTNDITKNLPPEESFELIKSLLGTDFNNAIFFGANEEVQCEISKKGKVAVRAKMVNASSGQSTQHDREKKRYVDINRPFLTALKVTDQQQQLIPGMSRKWKQINKFIEVFSQAFNESQLSKVEDTQQVQPIQVVDFGSGKGYLTFAIHDYLRHSMNLLSQVTGVELRPALAELCNNIAKELHHDGLNFVCGDVKTHAPKHTDVMIALHACDIATDFAIHYGIRANASIIMCSPCCHKQIRPQIKTPELLSPMLQYGVHLGQEAEMVTDSLRALLLEANGYATKVFEFVSLEHTNKNKMILATKRKHTIDNQQILQQINAIKSFYGITEHCLETLLLDSAV